MKPLWLREVQAILEREDVNQWWQFIGEAEQKLAAVHARREELLAQVKLVEFRAEQTQKNAIDALYQAGEYEDHAAQLESEAAEVENRSYEALANFETQRISVSDLFSRMDAHEHLVLNIQGELKALQEALQAATDGVRKEELTKQIRRKEAERTKAERDLRESSAVYERENARKIKLWEEVEQMWSRSLDMSLGVAERRMRSRRSRLDAERQFRDSEGYKARTTALQKEVEETQKRHAELLLAIENHRSEARLLMGCLVGEEFLSWQQRENNKKVYCVPIGNHPTGFNIELKARTIYQISRQRGVEFIEPLPPPGAVCEEGDRRIDAFFGNAKNDIPEPAGS